MVDRVLIAQRPAGKHLAGGWEFPGGKVDAGETAVEALARELDEELGVELLAAHPLIRLRHAYADRCIDLDVWKVTAYRGISRGAEGQAMRWCSQDQLPSAGLVGADRPVVTAILLPETIASIEGRHYVVAAPGVSSDPRRLTGRFCSDRAQACSLAESKAADFLMLSRELAPSDIERLTRDCNLPVYVRGVPLATAWECGASGLHELIEPAS